MTPDQDIKTNAHVDVSALSAVDDSSPSEGSDSQIYSRLAEDNQGAIELVFGFVGPTGVDLTKISSSLKGQLKSVGYAVEEVRLSDLILPYVGSSPTWEGEYERIDDLMTRGTSLRRESGLADIVGRLGVAKIRHIRSRLSGDSNRTADKPVAYIVRSFKRQEEVALFRDIYGKAFNLISVYSPRAVRIQHLRNKFQSTAARLDITPEELAVKIVNRDYEEAGKLGQQVGKTFPMADFFVSSSTPKVLDAHFKRFVRLLLGDPYISPSREEQGMFFAQAAAYRSMDLSRQVGAAVVNDEGDVLATGCNEVPKFGGGLYWEDDPGVMRDFELGKDMNAVIKEDLVEDAFRRIRKKGILSDSSNKQEDADLAKDALYGEDPYLRDSKIFDVIEFGRAVHAEMAAISQAARLGISLKGSRLFCTTFPCHICARHIVASGVREVQFIEPYEKSRTNELFADSISVEPQEPSPARANFRSFVGVAPRRYMDFFAMDGSRKSKDGATLEVDAIKFSPRIKRIVFTYLLTETIMISPLADKVFAIKGGDDGKP